MLNINKKFGSLRNSIMGRISTEPTKLMKKLKPPKIKAKKSLSSSTASYVTPAKNVSSSMKKKAPNLADIPALALALVPRKSTNKKESDDEDEQDNVHAIFDPPTSTPPTSGTRLRRLFLDDLLGAYDYMVIHIAISE
jgi:hypothetical protein